MAFTSPPQTTRTEDQSSIFSKLLFSWAQPLFTRASQRHKVHEALEIEDLIPLVRSDYGQAIGNTFERAWQEQLNKYSNKKNKNNHGEQNGKIVENKASLARTIQIVIGRKFVFAGIVKAVNTCIQFTFPLLLNAILKFIEDTQNEVIQIDVTTPWHKKYQGYWLSVLLFIAMSSKAIAESMYFHSVNRAAFQAKAAISLAVYNKALRLSSAERHGTTFGEMINLMQVDASKVEMFLPQFHVLWDGMLQIIGYLTILYTLIGWPCFAGLGIMILAGPVQGLIMQRLFGLNRSMVKHTDERVKTTNEAIQGIRCVKMYTWEESFQAVIGKGRQDELDMLKRMSYLRGASRAYMGALPGIVAVVSFIVYAVGTNGEISASTLFAALVAFGQLRFPLLFYPMALAHYVQASVSAKRIEAFLKLKETRNDEDVYNRKDSSLKTGQIVIKNSTIYWGDPETPIPINEDIMSSDTSSSNDPNKSKSNDIDAMSNNSTGETSNNTEETEVRYYQPVINNVDLNVSSGELLAIIGRVGSGKSTLCSAMLNETFIEKGTISLNGSVAYVAQSAWILNATLRDNITFGRAFDQERYDKIVTACQLTHDISLLEYGDMTEIGENGINLSGGQRQRVSIARAAYSDADIIVMDDPLSALDPEVAKNLFDECIVNFMNNKTRVLVTNQLQFLKHCDYIVGLDKGVVSEQGTFDALSTSNGDVAKFLADLESKEKGATKSTSKTAEKEKGKKEEIGQTLKEKKGNDGGGGLVSKEERLIGAVSFQVYQKYIRAGGGYLLFFFIFILFIMCAGIDLLNTLWITLWTNDANYERQPQSFYLGYYALSCFASGIFVFLRTMFLARFGVSASRQLHIGLLSSILRAPMSFFDATPTGRIMSRFSNDLYSVDLEITDNMDFALWATLTVATSLGTITIVTPWFGVALVPVLYMYYKVLNYFREVSRETKRLESISRSPVFAHFSETLGGLSTISAYDQGSRFINDFEVKVDRNTQATYNNRTADRWLSVRLELLGSLIAGLAAVFACSVVINKSFTVDASTRNFASVAGLSINYAISVTSVLNWVVRTFAKMEASMNAAERVLYYTEEIPQEAPYRTNELKVLADRTNNDKRYSSGNLTSILATKAKGNVETTDTNWPSSGRVTIKNLKMRYRDENPLVLKGIDVEIDGGSRVGVVGRTGSGKSSLLLTLLRIVEPSIDVNNASNGYDAPICIDGVDILRIGLTELRSAIGIIPQHPVLFSGTVRSNMDPFHYYNDEEIWNALDGCGMKSTIEEMPGLLDAPVAEYGDNLSQGQRQLLCLGRALLKKCRILLLDEATSSVDYETDKEIQRTLREAFSECTVLTIAHRVDTILDSDKILVMMDGKVGEYASPKELLADGGSIFSDIVRHSKTESTNSLNT